MHHQTKIIVGILLLYFGSVLFAAVLSFQSLNQLRSTNISKSAQLAASARIPVEFFSAASLRQIPDIESWRHGLILLSGLEKYSTISSQVLHPEDSNAYADLRPAANTLDEINKHVQLLDKNIAKAQLFRLVIKKYQPNLSTDVVSEFADLTNETNQVLHKLIEGNQTWIVLLQNSDELRATGGFAGSYIKVPIKDGQITDLIVEDIYDADGQFTGYIPAPPGVDEYLSSNKGLRLPDANWFPDYKHSSEQMLEFYSHSLGSEPEGIIAINLPLVQKLLETIGPLEIPDYDTTLTADSINVLLRSERDSFFPGSNQKKHLLSLAIQQFLMAVESLSANQYQQVVGVVLESAPSKQLLAYSPSSKFQKYFEKLGISGRVANDHQASDYLYLVESNVGINKANRGVERSVAIDWQEYRTVIEIDFTNNNQPKTATEIQKIQDNNTSEALHNGYANYQRILVLPNWEVQSIVYDNRPINNYDQSTITNPEGESFKQIGFLVTLPEGESKKLQIEFTRSPIPMMNKKKPLLTIQKQPGLENVPYTISTSDAERTFTLSADTTFLLPEAVDLQGIPTLMLQ